MVVDQLLELVEEGVLSPGQAERRFAYMVMEHYVDQVRAVPPEVVHEYRRLKSALQGSLRS